MPVLLSAHLPELLARLLQATRGIAYVAQLDPTTGKLYNLAVAEEQRARGLLALENGAVFADALESALLPDDQPVRNAAFRAGTRSVQTRFRYTDPQGTVHWLHEEAIVEGTQVVGVLTVLPVAPPATVTEPIAPIITEQPAPRPRGLRLTGKPTTSRELERALAENQFTLAYQFQLDPAKRALVGAEVFVRWRHPSQGLLFPGRFLQQAEESGLILPLGNWVIETACEQQQAWHQQGFHLPLSFNTVVEQLASPGFSAQLPDAAIRLELPESALALHRTALLPYLSGLSDRGVAVGIDNAGLGALPHEVYQNLPLHFVKLARALVQELESEESQHKARALAQQAREFGLELLADGVETTAQAQWLQHEGYQVLQGYLYSRPVAAEALEDVMRSGSYLLPTRSEPTKRAA